MPKGMPSAIALKPPRWDLPARMLVATGFVLVITAVANQLGPQLSGLIAPFPVFGLVFAAFAHAQQGSEACAVVRQNLKAAGLFEKASVAETAAEVYLAACRERFDLVLLDPPYHQGTVTALLPAVAAVVAPGGAVLAETEHGASLPEHCGALTLKKQYKYGKVALARYEADAAF